VNDPEVRAARGARYRDYVNGRVFGIGVALLMLIVEAVIIGSGYYGRCSNAIDAGMDVRGQGFLCDWAAVLHKPAIR